MTAPVGTLVEWENAMIETFASGGDALGFPRSVSMIYGLLYCSRDPLSMEDIMLRLSISKGSASQGLKQLTALGAVNKQIQLGVRKTLYVAERSLKRLVQRLLDTHISPRLESGAEKVRAVSAMIPEGAENDYARSCNDSLEAWHSKASRLLPMINMILK
jgi:DNA-binding transcriptional regulator GbsR (MarR family)